MGNVCTGIWIGAYNRDSDSADGFGDKFCTVRLISNALNSAMPLFVRSELNTNPPGPRTVVVVDERLQTVQNKFDEITISYYKGSTSGSLQKLTKPSLKDILRKKAGPFGSPSEGGREFRWSFTCHYLFCRIYRWKSGPY